MKVAICFYGLHPDECWKDKTPKSDKTFDLFTKNILNYNDCDIFIHSFSKKSKELLKYKPKNYLFEDQELFLNTTDKGVNIYKNIKSSSASFEKRGLKYYGLSTGLTIYLISYGIKKSVELMEKYSTENNINYDLVLLSRMDVAWMKPVNFNELDTSKFYTSLWYNKQAIPFHLKNEFLAYWFISNQKNIKKYSQLYNQIINYLKSCSSYHKISYDFALTFIKKQDIEYKFHDIYSKEETDMDLQRYLF